MDKMMASMDCTFPAPAAELGVISDHFRLPWRFHARVVAARDILDI